MWVMFEVEDRCQRDCDMVVRLETGVAAEVSGDGTVLSGFFMVVFGCVDVWWAVELSGVG